jgi:hypothetical protein
MLHRLFSVHRLACNPAMPPQRLHFGEIVARLASDLRERYAGRGLMQRPQRHPYPLRVLDCALAVSLSEDVVEVHGAAYRHSVADRVEAFGRRHPEVRTLTDLRALVARFATPADFARSELGQAEAERGEIVLALLDYLIQEQQTYSDADDEPARLADWAAYSVGDISDFAFGATDHSWDAGFQYLRALFGAPVLVPGAHLNCFVGDVLGERVLWPPEDLLGEAAASASLPLFAVEEAIWADYAEGQMWTAATSSSNEPEPGWLAVLADLSRLLAHYAGAKQLDARAVADVHRRLSNQAAGADHAERGDYLAALNALPRASGNVCFGQLAAAYLRAFYSDLLGHPFDVTDDLAVAHRDTVHLLRHLAAQSRPVSEGLTERLRALAEASGGHIMRRDRLAF